MIKNIIFDWCGVIKDAAKQQLVLINKIFVVYGRREISLEEMQNTWEQPHMDFYNKYLPEINAKEQAALYRKFILEEKTPDATPGIIDLIKSLKDLGRILIVVSSDLSDTLIPEIEKYGLAGVFSEVIADVETKEPAVRELMIKNSFNLDETIFIGDSNCEVEVGKKIGIKTCAVTWGLVGEDRLAKMNPDFLVHNVKELEEILK